MINRQKLLAAAQAAEIAAAADTPEAEMRAVMAVWEHKEAIQIGLITERMQRLSQTPHVHERLPLVADGDDFGRVEARIPKDLFFHLAQQRNFGMDGFTSDEGMRDLLQTHPACKVKTISGKTTVGYTGGAQRSARPTRAVFGPGTMTFAR